MAASAGTMFIEAVDDGAVFKIDLYQPDAVATKICFSNIGLAASTSPDYWSAPEDCILTDISVVTGATAVGGTLTFDGAPVPNQAFRWSNQLNTLATRGRTKWFIPKGTQVGILQF